MHVHIVSSEISQNHLISWRSCTQSQWFACFIVLWLFFLRSKSIEVNRAKTSKENIASSSSTLIAFSFSNNWRALVMERFDLDIGSVRRLHSCLANLQLEFQEGRRWVWVEYLLCECFAIHIIVQCLRPRPPFSSISFCWPFLCLANTLGSFPVVHLGQCQVNGRLWCFLLVVLPSQSTWSCPAATRTDFLSQDYSHII